MPWNNSNYLRCSTLFLGIDVNTVRVISGSENHKVHYIRFIVQTDTQYAFASCLLTYDIHTYTHEESAQKEEDEPPIFRCNPPIPILGAKKTNPQPSKERPETPKNLYSRYLTSLSSCMSLRWSYGSHSREDRPWFTSVDGEVKLRIRAGMDGKSTKNLCLPSSLSS
jgi:hypothetical protein